jgi:hypothetical protein
MFVYAIEFECQVWLISVWFFNIVLVAFLQEVVLALTLPTWL